MPFRRVPSAKSSFLCEMDGYFGNVSFFRLFGGRLLWNLAIHGFGQKDSQTPEDISVIFPNPEVHMRASYPLSGLGLASKCLTFVWDNMKLAPLWHCAHPAPTVAPPPADVGVRCINLAQLKMINIFRRFDTDLDQGDCQSDIDNPNNVSYLKEKKTRRLLFIGSDTGWTRGGRGRWSLAENVREMPSRHFIEHLVCTGDAEKNWSRPASVRELPSRHFIEHVVCVGCVRGKLIAIWDCRAWPSKHLVEQVVCTGCCSGKRGRGWFCLGMVE
ncbi:hypothetical protein LXL04_010034 [Taraxacum kok-saghyz]